MLRVGLSARIMTRSSAEFGMGGKSVQYLEQSMANALARAGGLVFLIPSIGTSSELSSEHFHPCMYAKELDALVLQGGVDICPETYGEKPLLPSILGDPLRDRYELALIESFMRLKKPVLGICRGMQLINVSRGGTLCQDIPTEIGSKTTHLCEESREKIEHPVQVLPNSYLANLYGNHVQQVNSIHHQCVKKLGRDLVVEAISPDDGVIEAIRYVGDSYLFGVQWHPEFTDCSRETNLNADVFFKDFMDHADRRRKQNLFVAAGSLAS